MYSRLGSRVLYEPEVQASGSRKFEHKLKLRLKLKLRVCVFASGSDSKVFEPRLARLRLKLGIFKPTIHH